MDVFFFSCDCPGGFLIPYLLMLFLEGIPLFCMELAIGQKMRLGSIGAWTAISPYLGGLGQSPFIYQSFHAIKWPDIIIIWSSVLYRYCQCCDLHVPMSVLQRHQRLELLVSLPFISGPFTEKSNLLSTKGTCFSNTKFQWIMFKNRSFMCQFWRMDSKCGFQ